MANKETTALNQRIGQSYNQYFTFTNDSIFYALSPAYLRQYYNTMVSKWSQWISGWVYDFHSIEKGILPTMFASSYCHKLAQLIYGEGIIYESTKDSKKTNKSLDFITSEYEEEADLSGIIKEAIAKSAELGNCLLKLNSTSDNRLWIDAIPGNRFFVDLDSRGKVIRSRSYVSIYTVGVAQQGKQADSYGLVEDRYWKEVDKVGKLGNIIGKENVPMICYKVYKLTNTFTDVVGNGINYDQLPRSVQNRFRDEYGTVMLNQEKRLPLINLGVFLVKHSKYVSTMPNIKLGESALHRILNYLPQYDAADSEFTLDIRVSRPKVILPQHMGKGSKGSTLDDLDGVIYDRVENMSDKDQTPTIFAPAMRVSSLEAVREGIIKKCALQTGISVNSIASDITDGRGQVTATQISSENSNTASYITDKRKIVIKEINDLIRTILLYYNLSDSVKASFIKVGVNKQVDNDITVNLVQNKLMSRYQAIKESHPDWSEDQIEAEISEIQET